jgi:hypothetical protein
MVCHRDLTAYLLAIKSLYIALGRGKILIINDGTLSDEDFRQLHRHIPDLEVLDYHKLSIHLFPRADFFWERLVKVIELSNHNYVIQLDADTVVSAPVPEVLECLRHNRSFMLGTASGQFVGPATQSARMVQGWIQANNWSNISVGTEAEASLDKLPAADKKCYVHASAGFAGFAHGAFRLSDLGWFSARMTEILGPDRWKEYGSEQIASNYMLANAPDPLVLPFPKYACFEPHLEYGDHAFLHFLGAYRYDGGVYRRWAAEAIARYHILGQHEGDFSTIPSGMISNKVTVPDDSR